ncbi:hypothetical protein GQ457_01G003800 [Hibiscus cannabinus]
MSLSSSSSLIPTPICVPDDTSALIQFRNAMSIHEPNVDFCDGTAHPKTDSWNETTNCCTWEGVTCDNATGQVIGLGLGCSMLAGSLAPDTSLSGLRGLKRLNLSYNDFKHSSIPLGFSRLVSLTHLDLSGSSFSGFVPPVVSLPSKLISLDLSTNDLTFDSHSFGMLTGNLSELQNLFLDSVDIFDVEPTSLVNLSLSLKHLSLPNCDLQGEFPSEIFQLRNLEYLDLSFNYLTGHLPKFNWSSPLRLSVLPYLQVLILHSNGFYGGLHNSKTISSFLSLQVIDLSQNDFIDPLPTKFFRNLRVMKHVIYHPTMNCGGADVMCVPRCENCNPDEYKTIVKLNMKRLEMELDLKSLSIGFTLIDFSNNQFDGRSPEVLAELSALLVLNLSHNSLTGPLPPSLGSIAALESLDLSWNKLGGRIPSELTKQTFLEVLDLSRNNFIGPIPVGNQFNTFDNDSYAGNLALCGLPLSNKCGNDEEPSPPTLKLGEDSAIDFTWKLVMMGYMCGVVLGLSMGYVVLTIGRPRWLARMVERDWQRNFARRIHMIGMKTN